MNWFKRHAFEWQTWPKWHFGLRDVHYMPGATKRYLIVGPFQMRWWK